MIRIRRATAGASALLGLFAAISAACGAGAPGAVLRAASPEGPATRASASSPPLLDERTQCDRVCAVQTRCGGDRASCHGRCLPIARVLAPDVTEAMVACVESRASREGSGCDTSEEKAAARRRLVGTCTVEATQTREVEARANITLFAKAHCERAASCAQGGTATSGTSGPVPNLTNCMAEAKGAILSTESKQSGALYGALRASKIEELVACLGAPCDERRIVADEDLGRCLDQLLAHAAETR